MRRTPRKAYSRPYKAARVRECNARLRVRALSALGDVCVRCGFDDPRALQIDHIDGGGTSERRKIGTYGIWHRVVDGEPGYQLLCANCNWIKRAEMDEQIRKYPVEAA